LGLATSEWVTGLVVAVDGGLGLAWPYQLNPKVALATVYRAIACAGCHAA